MNDRMLTRDRVLSGRYRVEAEIGRGGMARVYRATDTVLGRTVAIKVLDTEQASDHSFVDRFRREARAAARLNHPGVVAVFDTGSDDGVHYIIMEYVHGRTLGQVVAEEGPLPPDRAAAIATSVAEALSFAHAEGLVHRDVKPANVMLTDSGRVKVMDFGIARVVSAHTLTQTAKVFGTAAYLSPEQAQGQRVDGRSDVYALGVVLYEMLTGRAPFAADSPVALAFKHINEEPAPPSSVRRGIPAGLEAVVMRALAKDPDARYPGAAEMATALGPFAAAAGAAGAAGVTTEPRVVLPDSTVRLPTAEVPEALTGPARTVPAHRASPRRRRWWPALLALLVLLGLLTAAFLPAMLSGGGPRTTPKPSAPHRTAPPSHRASPTPPSPTPGPTPPSPTPSPEPTTPAPEPTIPSVPDAVASISGTLAGAQASETIDQHTADDVRGKVEDALRHYTEGDLDKALDDIQKARDKLAEDADHGKVALDVANALDRELRDLAAAMQASPPPTEEGEDHGGHGHGGDEGQG